MILKQIHHAMPGYDGSWGYVVPYQYTLTCVQLVSNIKKVKYIFIC